MDRALNSLATKIDVSVYAGDVLAINALGDCLSIRLISKTFADWTWFVILKVLVQSYTVSSKKNIKLLNVRYSN